MILCERGVRTFADYTRNTLDLSVDSRCPTPQPPADRGGSDPRHGTAQQSACRSRARRVAVGADGILVEVHHDPDRALSDGPQSILPEEFDQLIREVRDIAAVTRPHIELSPVASTTGCVILILLLLSGLAAREVALRVSPVVPATRPSSFRLRRQHGRRHGHRPRPRETLARGDHSRWRRSNWNSRSSYAQGNLGPQFRRGLRLGSRRDDESNCRAHSGGCGAVRARFLAGWLARVCRSLRARIRLLRLIAPRARLWSRGRAGRRPWIARVSPDGKMLVVSNRDDATISVLDAATLSPRGVIPVAPQPEQIAILPDCFKGVHHVRIAKRNFRGGSETEASCFPILRSMERRMI